MKQKSTIGFSLFKLPVLAGVFLGLVASLAVFAGAERSNEVRNDVSPIGQTSFVDGSSASIHENHARWRDAEIARSNRK